MPIEAKISLMNSTEKALSSQVTADDMNIMLKTMADVLQDYEVIEVGLHPDQNDDLLESYLDALKVEGRSQKTIERYEYEIRRMMKAISVPTRQITVYHVRAYISAEQKRGISERTLDGNRQVFSAYFGWLHREGLIDHNPMGNIGAIKVPKKKKQIYSPVDIEKLDDKCLNLKYSTRNRAIVAFLRSTGCRISEVTGLNRDSVDLSSLEVVVLGKGNKERKVYMDEVTGMLLQQYFEERKDNCEALFAGAQGERLKPGGVRAMLNKLGDMANIEHVHPHKFRRTLATNLNRRGMPIQEVANILGHEKLDTTMKYVVLNDEDLKNSYRRYT